MALIARGVYSIWPLYSEYCYEKKQYLTDNEYIEIALKEQLKRKNEYKKFRKIA